MKSNPEILNGVDAATSSHKAVETPFVITSFSSQTDNKPDECETTWTDLCENLQFRDIREKKDGPAFSGAEYKVGGTRSDSNVVRLHLAIFDIDYGDPDTFEEKCVELDWQGVLYSTHQHTAKAPRFRAVFRPSRPILPNEWKSIWPVMNGMLGGDADSKARDLSRMYFLPSAPAATEKQAFVTIIDGANPVDIDKLLAMPIPKAGAAKPVKKGSSGSSEELKIREVTDAVHAAYAGRLWYHCENFRLYENGYWRKTDQRTEIVKQILEDFPWLTAAGSNEVVETLKILCSTSEASGKQEVIQIDPELMRRLICMRNGTLDPITGELLPHAREYRRLCALNIDWDPNAKAPRFLQFLDEIWGMEPDYSERISFLQEFMGYMLLPSNKLERFLWLTGSGANGKSVLLELMANVVGRENTTWVHLDRLNKTAVRASLEGVMLNISTEMNADGTMADGYLKSITSGEPIDAEPKYKAPYSFIPTVKLVAATNHLPRLKDTSGGFARRAVILSCNKIFTEAERDADLGEKLAGELDGILVWAVDGLKRLLARNRFVPPASSDAAVQTYRTEADSVAMFNHECLDPCSVGTTSGELYAAYREFCTTNGFHPTNVAIFGRRLTEVNIGTLRKSSGKPIRAAKFRVPIADDYGVMAEQPPSNVRTLSRKATKVSADEMFGEYPVTDTAS